MDTEKMMAHLEWPGRTSGKYLLAISIIVVSAWLIMTTADTRGFRFPELTLVLTNGSDTGSSSPRPEHRNHLGDEKSPYLLQHATNPIWWYAWGPEALAAAKRENKPIFLSIGYSTCYWCHFMEEDSFEKEDVAAILNRDFICIKVDREERPDVDNIYMTGVISMGGGGGWPLSAFLTPDGVPFFGRSTIPHDQFISICSQIAEVWKTRRDEVMASATEVAEVMRRNLNPDIPPAEVGRDELAAYLASAKSQYDPEFGGFGQGTKFPRPHLLTALLRVHERTRDAGALTIVTRTLKAMARGGMNDLLGGGFHRYSVDREWNVPHFEKMLYDNAGLAVAYLDGFEATRDSELLLVARNTLDWTLVEMTHPEGGFYSARDAGEYEEEGNFYAWRLDEVKALLTAEEFARAKTLFALTDAGNFEGGRNVLHIPASISVPDPRNDAQYRSIREKLLARRATRKATRLDDKVLTAWNGLMIAAMARGYEVSGDTRYLDAARRSARFIRTDVAAADGTLRVRWREGEARVQGMQSDYAYLIYGLLNLHHADGDTGWLDWAVALQKIEDDRFWDTQAGGYFLDNNSDGTLLFRSKEYDDMAMPSGNSIAALNLLRLGEILRRPDYTDRGRAVIRSAGTIIKRSPFTMPQMLVALDASLPGRGAERPDRGGSR
jgi:uncharacterized protein YyaL (SSP411 family)